MNFHDDEGADRIHPNRQRLGKLKRGTFNFSITIATSPMNMLADVTRAA